jgi:hypothetical protein
MRTRLKETIYWRLLKSANSGRRGGLGDMILRVEVTVLTSPHPLVSTQGILCVYQSGAKVVDLPLSGKQMVT